MSVVTSDLKPTEVFNVNVGILGHVDSGKTSLVKALSTLLSTASLDKNPQSIARGITLDLGFSAFLLPLPSRLTKNGPVSGGEPGLHLPLSASNTDEFKALQFTLVDCPGHASLIRTIIGGAQIIDMMILVVNVLKGMQTQTAECLVVGEICTKNLIVVLNKVDLIPENERAARVASVEKSLRSTLKSTKFANCPIVSCAACVGGERIAAVNDGAGAVKGGNKRLSSAAGSSFGASELSGSGDSVATTAPAPKSSNSIGLDDLLSTMTRTIELPTRRDQGPFFFSIDHCFPIKGQGTVVTGTVLSGSVKVNDMVEIPDLRTNKKVKSMQMFHKSVKTARQGDRLGMCLAGLDSKTVERGIACTPGSVPSLHAAVALVQRIRYFKGEVKSGSKVHVTIGHSTVLATVTFFGHKELYRYGRRTSLNRSRANSTEVSPATSLRAGGKFETGVADTLNEEDSAAGLKSSPSSAVPSPPAAAAAAATATAGGGGAVLLDQAARSRVAMINDLKAKCSKIQKEKVAPAKKAKLNCDEALAEVATLKKQIDELSKLLPPGALGGKSTSGQSKAKSLPPPTPAAVASLSSGGGSDLPNIAFEWDRDYMWQDEMCRGRGPQTTKDNGVDEKRHDANRKDDADDDDGDGGAYAALPGSTADGVPAIPGLQWALLRFETPVLTPLQGLLIASKLDTDVNTAHCRIAFYGRLTDKASAGDASKTCTAVCDPRIQLFKMKMRVGSVSRLGTVVASSQQEPQAERAVVQKEQQRSSAKRPNGKSKGCGGGGRYEDVLGKDLFKKETDIKQFIGKKVVSESGAVGVIESSFGQSGKFKVEFAKLSPGGVPARVNERLVLQFKKFLNDPKKEMMQDEECLLLQASPEQLQRIQRQQQEQWDDTGGSDAAATDKATTPLSSSGTRQHAGGGGGCTKMKSPCGREGGGEGGDAGSGTKKDGKEEGERRDKALERNHQLNNTSPLLTASPRKIAATALLETLPPLALQPPPLNDVPSVKAAPVVSSPVGMPVQANPNAPPESTLPPTAALSLRRCGTVVKVKEVGGAGEPCVVIVEGFFTPEEDVKRFEGRQVLILDKVGVAPAIGSLLSPFGKGGKCKVNFGKGSPPPFVGARVEMN